MPTLDPGFLIYPVAYRLGLVQTCSLAAQGLWLQLQILMTGGSRYGFLERRGKPLPSELTARMAGTTLAEYSALMHELETNQVFSYEARTRTIYCPSLVKQGQRRAKLRARVRKYRALKSDTERETNHEQRAADSSS